MDWSDDAAKNRALWTKSNREYTDENAAVNWALEDIPEDRIRFHTCWGSWHTPHITDLPLRHVADLMLQVKAGAYSIEAADVQHELDYQVWEGVSHFLMMERPQEFDHTVQEFLTKNELLKK